MKNVKISKGTTALLPAKGFSTTEFVIVAAIITVMLSIAIPAIKVINKTEKAKPVALKVSKAYNKMLDAGKVPPEVMNGKTEDIVKFIAGKGEDKVDIGDTSPDTVAFLLQYKPGPYLIVVEAMPYTPADAPVPSSKPKKQ